LKKISKLSTARRERLSLTAFIGKSAFRLPESATASLNPPKQRLRLANQMLPLGKKVAQLNWLR
jgi:hypothetical protein